MSVEAAVHSLLSGYAPLVVKVGARIYPDVADQDETPAIVLFAKTDVEYITTLTGAVALTRNRIAVRAFDKVKDEAEAVLDLAIAAFAAQNIAPESRAGDYDDEAGLFTAVAEFDYWA